MCNSINIQFINISVNLVKIENNTTSIMQFISIYTMFIYIYRTGKAHIWCRDCSFQKMLLLANLAQHDKKFLKIYDENLFTENFEF